MPQSQLQFDAAIIGGGVIGSSIAWRLAQAGMRVAVLERGAIGREASWAAGGMLAPLAEANKADAFFACAVASRAMYADFARELREASGIDIEYRTEGTLYLALTDEDEEELAQRWQWQHAAGLQVKKLKADCVLKLEPALNPKLRWALQFPDDHQVNNRQLVAALEVAIRKLGVEIFTQTEVEKILISNIQVTGVATSRGEIKANSVIIAAGSWSGLVAAKIKSHIEPVRGQMIALEMTETKLKHIIYSSRGYLIPRLSGVVIAGATTERVGYDKAVTAGGIHSIVENAVEIMPQAKALKIKETWSGLRPGSSDELPILGNDPKITGLVYATGHYRNGILLTPITAQAISQLVLRGASEFNLQAFSPERFAVNATCA